MNQHPLEKSCIPIIPTLQSEFLVFVWRDTVLFLLGQQGHPKSAHPSGQSVPVPTARESPRLFPNEGQGATDGNYERRG